MIELSIQSHIVVESERVGKEKDDITITSHPNKVRGAAAVQSHPIELGQKEPKALTRCIAEKAA